MDLISKIKRPAFAALLIMIPLLRVDMSYTGDWRNHLWMASYFSNYWLHHFQFPRVFNTDQIIGMPNPIFYGSMLYKLLALPGIIIGTGTVFRFVVFFLFILQILLIKKILKKLRVQEDFSYLISILWVWSIYPLTNLYHRSALTEFVAVALLTCAILAVILLFIDTETNINSKWPWAMGFLFTLCAGTHPITALLGGVFTLTVFIFFIQKTKSKAISLGYLFLNFLLSLLCIAPWIYATHTFQNYLQILVRNSKIDTLQASPALWWLRYLPFPYDPRIIDPNQPRLFTQINIYLGIIALALLWHTFKYGRKRIQTLSIVCLAYFIVSVALVSSSQLWEHIPKIYHSIQLSYRLISYADLSLLLLIISLLLDNDILKIKSLWNIKFINGLLLFSGISLAVNLFFTFQAQIAKEDNYSRFMGSRKNIDHIPPTFYSLDDYSTYVLYSKPEENLKLPQMKLDFKVEPVSQFGGVQPASLALDVESLVQTNIQPFPWNKIYVNGSESKEVFVLNNALTLLLKPGRYNLKYAFVADNIYNFLTRISAVVFWGWLLLLMFWSKNLWRYLKN